MVPIDLARAFSDGLELDRPHRKQQYMRQTQGCRRLTEATAKMSAVRRLSAAALPTETTRDWDKLGFGLDQVGHVVCSHLIWNI